MATLRYTVHLHPAEEGGFTVTVPAMPAIVTEGDTFEDALAMAKDAIELYIEYLKDEGRPIPKADLPADTHIIEAAVEVAML